MMKAEDVARYLQENPAFFERHADLLMQIQVPHPHGGRAIPLSDRQVLSLREKNRALEAKLAELIRFGEENDGIGEKVHRLAVALLTPKDLETLLSSAAFNLREDFAIPHVALRLWRGGFDLPEFAPVSEELIRYAAHLAHPYCGPNAAFEAAGWFGEASTHVRSCAFVRLADRDTTFGMLALGAEDPQRFYPEMGTLYLERIGELAGAALARFI